MKEQDLLFEKRLQELARTSYYRGIITYTDFLDLNELHIVHSFQGKNHDGSIVFSGGYEGAERQIAAFLPDALSYNETADDTLDYPIDCLKISPVSRKFSEKLTHRDFLGALIHMGIDRSKLGDLVLKDLDCFLFCHSHMTEYILRNLDKVKHTPVKLEQIFDPEEMPQPEFKEIQGTVASVRLDSMIALAFSSSRSSMLGLIEGGKVFVNGRLTLSNGYPLKPQDIVTVRGYGKFRYEGMKATTKKGRCAVIINRYGAS